jgi:hypothetical protein
MDAVTIPTGPAEHPILDYAALLRQGIAELERLTGDQWTDFNAQASRCWIRSAMR